LVNYVAKDAKYQIGYELLLINGGLSFVGYYLLSKIQNKQQLV